MTEEEKQRDGEEERGGNREEDENEVARAVYTCRHTDRFVDNGWKKNRLMTGLSRTVHKIWIGSQDILIVRSGMLYIVDSNC